MAESPTPSKETRRRGIALGEFIAIAALIVSMFGVWIAWKSSNDDKPTRVIEQRQAIPLTLRGRIEDDGRRLAVNPVEPSHAMESLTLTFPNTYPVELGSDGIVNADTVEGKLTGKDLKKGDHAVKVGVTVRYVEMGKDRKTEGRYVLRYRIESGGLLGGRSLRLVGFGRG